MNRRSRDANRSRNVWPVRHGAISVSHLLIAVAVTALSLSIFAYTGYWAVAFFYLLAVVLAGNAPAPMATLFLAALSALLWNFLFIPPRFTFYIGHLHDFMMFGAYFVIALVIGHLATQLREREQSERRREERATALYRLTRGLAASRDLDEAMPKVLTLIKNFFQADAAVWLRDEGGLSHIRLARSRPRAKTKASPMWAFQKKQSAGRSTDTLPDAECVACAACDGRSRGRRAHRAARVHRRPSSNASCSMRSLSQLALFVNKERALEESREAQVARQSQKLQKTLFDSVSHELKTPLAAMSAAFQQAQPDRAELQQAVRRLTRTVDHLLDATRLESGLLQPVREWCDPGELVARSSRARRIKGDSP